MERLVLDSAPLSTFGRAGRLQDLDRLTWAYDRVTTRAVLDELHAGVAQFPALADVEHLPWLRIVSVDTLEELRPHIGEENVGRFQQTLDQGPTPGIVHIEREAALAAVVEIEGRAARLSGPRERGEQPAHRIAGRCLHLDHLGAPVGQNAARGRSGHPEAHLDHAHPGERAGGG